MPDEVKFTFKPNEDFDVPVQHCRVCGDEITGAFGEQKPIPGCITICSQCGAASVLDENLKLRKPTAEEKRQIDNDPTVRNIRMQLARAKNARSES